MMYSTGTEFHRLVGEATEKRINTAGDTVAQVKDVLSWTPFEVREAILAHGHKLTIRLEKGI